MAENGVVSEQNGEVRSYTDNVVKDGEIALEDKYIDENGVDDGSVDKEEEEEGEGGESEKARRKREKRERKERKRQAKLEAGDVVDSEDEAEKEKRKREKKEKKRLKREEEEAANATFDNVRGEETEKERRKREKREKKEVKRRLAAEDDTDDVAEVNDDDDHVMTETVDEKAAEFAEEQEKDVQEEIVQTNGEPEMPIHENDNVDAVETSVRKDVSTAEANLGEQAEVVDEIDEVGTPMVEIASEVPVNEPTDEAVDTQVDTAADLSQPADETVPEVDLAPGTNDNSVAEEVTETPVEEVNASNVGGDDSAPTEVVEDSQPVDVEIEEGAITAEAVGATGDPDSAEDTTTDDAEPKASVEELALDEELSDIEVPSDISDESDLELSDIDEATEDGAEPTGPDPADVDLDSSDTDGAEFDSGESEVETTDAVDAEIHPEHAYDQLKKLLHPNEQCLAAARAPVEDIPIPPARDVQQIMADAQKRAEQHGGPVTSSRVLTVRMLVNSQERLHTSLASMRQLFGDLDNDIATLRQQLPPAPYRLSYRRGHHYGGRVLL